MKSRDKDDASPEATPFFARYLEGQDAGTDAEAKVSEGRGQSNFTMKENARRGGAKKGAAKKGAAKKGGAKRSAAGGGGAEAKRPPLQTLKYPSDRDELVFYAYHAEAAEARSPKQTLKYPSDGDEDRGYYAVYADASDAPKSETATAKPKETGVRLSRKKPKG